MSKDETKILFEGNTHTYRLESGEIIPSVTQIIKDVCLIDYSGIPKDVLDYARDRGAAVHLACELYDKNDLKSCPELIEAYLQGWVDFVKNCEPVFSGIENIVYSKKYNYAGTVDRICKIDDTDWIIDIKTTKQRHKSHKLQTAGYKIPCDDYGYDFKRACVYLKDDGSYRFLPHCDDSDIKEFIEKVDIYNFKKRYQDRQL